MKSFKIIFFFLIICFCCYARKKDSNYGFDVKKTSNFIGKHPELLFMSAGYLEMNKDNLDAFTKHKSDLLEVAKGGLIYIKSETVYPDLKYGDKFVDSVKLVNSDSKILYNDVEFLPLEYPFEDGSRNVFYMIILKENIPVEGLDLTVYCHKYSVAQLITVSEPQIIDYTSTWEFKNK